jgi:hypothetical protein
MAWCLVNLVLALIVDCFLLLPHPSPYSPACWPADVAALLLSYGYSPHFNMQLTTAMATAVTVATVATAAGTPSGPQVSMSRYQVHLKSYYH